MLHRRKILDSITPWLYNEKLLILYGARQVGKTSILKLLMSNHPDFIILSCENPATASILQSKNIARIKLLFGSAKVVALDEAQKIENIGEILKFIYDHKEINNQIIATGSSSFELSNRIVEPLTGRNIKFKVFPYSLEEIIDIKGGEWMFTHLEDMLVYGLYPEIVESPIEKKSILLSNLASDYLFQDILQFENLRNSNQLLKLLKALAWQIGSEINYNELSQLLSISSKTVEKYIDLLEKSFVIFQLNSYSKNLRNELKKSKKVYFYDLGIRNALIANFNALDERQDQGGLWENFCIIERVKSYSFRDLSPNFYFWRTYDQAEIDFIEEYDGALDIYEFKFNPRKKIIKFPNSFLKKYSVSKSQIITSDNFEELII